MRLFVASNFDSRIEVYDISAETPTLLQTFIGSGLFLGVGAMVFVPSLDALLLLSGGTGQILQIDTATGARSTFLADDNFRSDMVYDAQSDVLITALANGMIQFVDPNNACLLYTSPSPRDATLSRMPSSA